MKNVKAPAESKARARRKLQLGTPIWERIPFGTYIVVGGALLLGLVIGLPTYFSQRHMGPPSPAEVAAVGKAAPAFSLKDQAGRSYTLTPGDGRAHLLVFYMGYF